MNIGFLFPKVCLLLDCLSKESRVLRKGRLWRLNIIITTFGAVGEKGSYHNHKPFIETLLETESRMPDHYYNRIVLGLYCFTNDTHYLLGNSFSNCIKQINYNRNGKRRKDKNLGIFFHPILLYVPSAPLFWREITYTIFAKTLPLDIVRVSSVLIQSMQHAAHRMVTTIELLCDTRMSLIVKHLSLTSTEKSRITFYAMLCNLTHGFVISFT